MESKGHKNDFEVECDEDYPQNIYWLSILCVNGSDTTKLDCYPDDNPMFLTFISGIWCIINSIFGIFGNSLTLISIPYAAKRKSFGLHRNWNTMNLFILNLAFVDLLYCLINLPTYAVQRLRREFPFGLTLSHIFPAYTNMNAFASWMSTGLVAMSRCLSICFPNAWKRFCSRTWVVYSIFVGVWIYVVVILMPIWMGVKHKLP